jgi:hypothetical protein
MDASSIRPFRTHPLLNVLVEKFSVPFHWLPAPSCRRRGRCLGISGLSFRDPRTGLWFAASSMEPVFLFDSFLMGLIESARWMVARPSVVTLRVERSRNFRS